MIRQFSKDQNCEFLELPFSKTEYIKLKTKKQKTRQNHIPYHVSCLLECKVTMTKQNQITKPNSAGSLLTLL